MYHAGYRVIIITNQARLKSMSNTASELITLAFIIIAASIAWIIAGYIGAVYGNWGSVAGIVIFLFELAAIANWRGWYF